MYSTANFASTQLLNTMFNLSTYFIIAHVLSVEGVRPGILSAGALWTGETFFTVSKLVASSFLCSTFPSCSLVGRWVRRALHKTTCNLYLAKVSDDGTENKFGVERAVCLTFMDALIFASTHRTVTNTLCFSLSTWTVHYFTILSTSRARQCTASKRKGAWI